MTNDEVRGLCDELLKPEYLATKEAVASAFPNATFYMHRVPLHDERGEHGFVFQCYVVFRPPSDEAEAVQAAFWWGRYRSFGTIRQSLHELAETLITKDDYIGLFEITTGRGSQISCLGPIFPSLMSPTTRDDQIRLFVSMSAAHLRNSRDVTLRALRVSEYYVDPTDSE